MVSLNFTFFVILGLFLVFLWAMSRFVFRPLLAVMDERDERVQTDRKQSRTVAGEAAAKEREYAQKLSALHQDAQLRIARAHRNAQEVHQAELEALKQRELHEVREARAEARRLIKEQRPQFDALAKTLSEAMRARLGLENGKS